VINKEGFYLLVCRALLSYLFLPFDLPHQKNYVIAQPGGADIVCYEAVKPHHNKQY
jgi:hypothetical protein